MSFLRLRDVLMPALALAAAPSVDVYLVRSWRWWYWTVGVLRDLPNGNQTATTVWPGTNDAFITPAGDATTTVLGPAELNLKRGKVTFVYAIGSLEDGTLDVLVQVRSQR